MRPIVVAFCVFAVLSLTLVEVDSYFELTNRESCKSSCNELSYNERRKFRLCLENCALGSPFFPSETADPTTSKNTMPSPTSKETFEQTLVEQVNKADQALAAMEGTIKNILAICDKLVKVESMKNQKTDE
uniref:Salivary secreted peptide n=1 Tax=Panagrellus redivivus TaxID=6233 RepID=A0A7E4V7C9_PANRE